MLERLSPVACSSVQADAATFRVLPDLPGVPLSLHLHALGMTGLTAYVGLTAVAELREGDTVFAYNTTDRTPGPDNLANVITRGLSLKGFTLSSYLHLAPEFRGEMSAWFADGRIAYDETVVDGIENTVDAFLAMMRGANTGKMLVRV